MKKFSNDFKTLFKKVTGLNALDIDKVLNGYETEAEAKQKIKWLVKSGVIAKKQDVTKLLNKLNSILDDKASTVDSWEEEVSENGGVDM